MDKASLIRTILLIVGLTNQILAVKGISPLPIADQDVELLVSTIYTVTISLVTWWKNNYISRLGQKQKELLQQNDLYRP